MTLFFQSITSPPSILYWLNLAVVVTLIGSASLVAVTLFQKRSEVFRHALVVASLIVLLVAPFAVGIGSYSQLGLLSIKNSHLEENLSISPKKEPVEVVSLREGFAQNPVFVDQDIVGREIAKDNKNEMPETVAISPARVPTSSTSAVGANIPWGQVGFCFLLIVWCGGTIWFVFQTIQGWRLIRKYLSLSSPITKERVLNASKTAAQRVGLTGTPSIFESPSVSVPISTGVFRSAIILPQNFLQNASQGELEAVLIHELAHIVRRDHWIGLLQRLTVAIYWWNPLIHHVSRLRSSLAEEICDDYVTKSLTNSEEFARLLVAMAERVVECVDIPLAIGILSSRRHDLERRVTRLMQKERKVKVRLSLNHVVLALLFGLLMTGTSVLSTVWADVSADNSGKESVAEKPKEEAEKTSSSKDTSSEEKASVTDSAEKNDKTSSPAEDGAEPEQIAALPQTTLRLLQDKYDGGFSKFSPDGTKMVYCKDSLITVSDLSTGLERKYEQAVGNSPVWSPDGRRIAFSDHKNGLDVAVQRISILSIESGDVETTDIRAFPCDWSKDRRFLLAVDLMKFDENYKGLHLVNLATRNTQKIIQSFKYIPRRSVRLSPDGNFVVYRDSVEEQNPDIFVMRIGSEKPIRITSHKGSDLSPVWSADGKHILFMSNRVIGRWDLLAIAFRNGKPMGEPKNIFSGMGSNISLLSCSKSGQLLFAKLDDQCEIFSTSVDPDSGNISQDIVQLTDNRHGNTWPNWSRDGKYIAYYEQTPDLKKYLWVMNANGEYLRKIIRANAFTGTAVWLPDNEHILYGGFHEDPENPKEYLKGVYSVSIRSREQKLIYQDPEFWGQMNLSPDAKHLAVATSVTPNAKKHQLIVVGLDGKNPRQLVKSDKPIYNLIFTPDGKEIIYTSDVYEDGKKLRTSIMAVTFEGGNPRMIFSYASENPKDYLDTSVSSWHRDGRYAIDIFSGGRRCHYALSLDGKSEPVKLSEKMGNGFRVSPDGTRAAFYKAEYDWKLWLMSGFLPNDELAKK